MSGLGATGDFPRGKFNAEDEGALRLGVAHKDKTVIINFGTSVTWIGLDAEGALQLADTIIRHAKECKNG